MVDDYGLVLSRKSRQNVSVRVMARDVEVKRSIKLQGRPGGGLRGRVTGLSAASRRNLLRWARNCPNLPVMLTLTYPAVYPTDGRLVKQHWDVLRRWLAHRGISGLWCLEFQERGAPHYHVWLSERVAMSSVAEAWYRIVGSEDPKHLAAGTRVETMRSASGMASYVAKYAAKMQQKEVPEEYQNVGRMWGTFGGLVCEEEKLEGTGEELATVVRTVKRAYVARRRSLSADGVDLKRWHDSGVRGFTAWEMGPAIKEYLSRLLE